VAASVQSLPAAWEREKKRIQTYTRRCPESTPLYRIISAGREKLEQCWEVLFEHEHGALRHEVLQAFDKFLECGVLIHGCAHAECTNPECNHAETIAFSCKRRCLCPKGRLEVTGTQKRR
jgi:hypothetical protein